jgi:phosphomevalonate kinase
MGGSLNTMLRSTWLCLRHKNYRIIWENTYELNANHEVKKKLGNYTLLLKHIDKTGRTSQATILCGLIAGAYLNVYSLVEQTRMPSLVW